MTWLLIVETLTCWAVLLLYDVAFNSGETDMMGCVATLMMRLMIVEGLTCWAVLLLYDVAYDSGETHMIGCAATL